jgi:DNA (cytosine-5)-methyltransferase 1
MFNLFRWVKSSKLISCKLNAFRYSKLLQESLPMYTSVTVDLFRLFDIWRPQQLADRTELKVDRIKYLIKLRKEFNELGDFELSQPTLKQKEILEHFDRGLRIEEFESLVTLLPKKIDGEKFKFVDLFAGIGGIRKPFSQIGGKCVMTCEWNEYAQKTYKANWADSPEHHFVSDIKSITQPKSPSGEDLTGSDQADYLDQMMPDHDLLLAGFPCQPFSIAGVSKNNSLNRAHGFDCQDQGQLFFDICRTLLVKQPPIAVLENVKNLKSHDSGSTFKVIKEMLTHLPDHQDMLFKEDIFTNKKAYWIANLDQNGPDPKIVDGKKFLPQHRERIVLLCIRKDIVESLGLDTEIDLRKLAAPEKPPSLRDILDLNSKVNEKYTLSQKLWDFLQEYKKGHQAKGNGFGFGLVKRNKKDVTRTLSARYYKDGSEILICQNDMSKNPARDGRPRRLTPQECARLMGFVSKGEEFNIPVSDTRAYEQFGNSVVVPVFEAVAKHIEPFIESITEVARKDKR